ncbi:MAG: hypothetical protein ACRDQY_05065 [Pseudonocardiaceae bacterium]
MDAAGTLWLTQARPITTLYPLPTPPDGGPHVYLCVSLAQGLTRPITPMGNAAFRLIASCASEFVFGAAVPDPAAGPVAFIERPTRCFMTSVASRGGLPPRDGACPPCSSRRRMWPGTATNTTPPSRPRR